MNRTRGEIETVAVKAGEVALKIVNKGSGYFDGTSVFREVFAAMVNVDTSPEVPCANPVTGTEESVS